MSRILFGTVALAALAVPACSPDVFGPARAEVAGRYIATVISRGSFTGAEFNYLSAGALLGLQLNGDGTFSGRLFMPDQSPDGSDLDVNLRGKWRRFGSKISLVPALPIFDAERAPFEIQANDKLRTAFGPDDGIMVIELTKAIPTDP